MNDSGNTHTQKYFTLTLTLEDLQYTSIINDYKYIFFLESLAV